MTNRASLDALTRLGPAAHRLEFAPVSSGVRAVLSALESRHVEHAVDVLLAAGLSEVLEVAAALADVSPVVPLTHWVVDTGVPVVKNTAEWLTVGAVVVPHTLGVGRATLSVIVLDEALLAADGAVPRAHVIHQATLLNGLRIRDTKVGGGDIGTSAAALLSGSVPHAALLGVIIALNLVRILREAAFNTLSFDDTARRINGALSVREQRTAGLAETLVIVPTALRTVGAESGICDGGARGDTDTGRSVPGAFGVGVTVGLSEVTEVALHLAEGTVPLAHGLEVADSRDSDAAASVLAGAGGAIPHALVSIVGAHADGVDHLRALEVAGVVDGVPFAEGISVATSLTFSSSSVVEVVGASIFAEFGVLVPLAGLVVGISSADVLGSRTVDALHLARRSWICTGHPLTEFGGEAESLRAEERSAETSTGIVDFVPTAFRISRARVVVLVAVLAELLALVASCSGEAAEEVGLAKSGVEVVAGRNALSIGVIPHAPLISLASIRCRVQDDTLLAAGRSACRQPFASRIHCAVSRNSVLVASLATSTTRTVPVAEPLSVTINVECIGGTGFLASISAGIVHAFDVLGAAGGIVGILDVAASLTLLRDVVVDTHGRKILAVSHCHHGASLLTLTSNGVEVTVHVGIAAILGIAARFASFSAHSVGPDTR